MAEDFDRSLQTNLTRICKDLSDIKDAVYGKPQAGWRGIITRVEETEKRVATIKEIQDAFTRDHERATKEQTARDKIRNRFYGLALTIVASILTGIVIQLFVLITTKGSPS